MAARAIPENGDLVVREEIRSGTRVYVLHTAPGPDQFVHVAQEEAISHALMWAQHDGVRVWLTDEGYDFLLLEDFRVTESV